MAKRGFVPDVVWIIVADNVPKAYFTKHRAESDFADASSGAQLWRHDLHSGRVESLGTSVDRDRTHCSSCGKAGEWYEFKPGDGRCKECAP